MLHYLIDLIKRAWSRGEVAAVLMGNNRPVEVEAHIASPRITNPSRRYAAAAAAAG